MRISFDRGNVLTHFPEMRTMARAFKESGHEVHCITGVEAGRQNDQQYTEEVAGQVNGLVGYTLDGIHLVYADDPEGVAPKKRIIAQKLGIDLHIDDSRKVTDEMLAYGIRAFHLEFDAWMIAGVSKNLWS